MPGGPGGPRSERERLLRPDPRLADWIDLLDELEAGGPLMREVVRGSLEAIPTPPAGRRE